MVEGDRAADVERDGRRLRRERNVDAVRSAILHLLESDEPLTLDAVAAGSNVTVRSIYRYFENLEAAVADARRHRLAELHVHVATAVPIEASLPLEQRIDQLVARRFSLERSSRPVGGPADTNTLLTLLDDEAVSVFQAEIESQPDPVATASIVAAVVRPAAVRAYRAAPGEPTQAATMLIDLLGRILGSS